MPMYYQQLFNQGLAGISRTSIISSVVNIGYVILLIGFLVGLYQALLRGGDLRALVGTAIKYLIVAILLANWTAVFRDVNNAANGIAQAIGNATGAGDMFASWLKQLKQQYDAHDNQVILKMITSTPAALTTALSLLAAYIIFPLAMLVFSFFYTLYGVILYVVGPLVIALLPITGANQLAKNFVVNLMVWNTWGILYAILGDLITAVNANQVSNLLNQGFLGFFHGMEDANLLGIASIVYALAIAFIPFLARRVISGEIGETMFSVIQAASTAMVMAFSAGAGMESAAASGGGAAGAGESSSAGSGKTGTAEAGASSGNKLSSASSSSSSSMPPRPTSYGEQLREGLKNAMGQGDRTAGQTMSGAEDGKPSSAGKGTSSPSSGSGKGASGSSGRPYEKDYSFRPRGVAQFVAFHAGRAAGKAIHNSGQNPPSESGGSNNEEKKS